MESLTKVLDFRDSNQNRQAILWSDVGREHREKARWSDVLTKDKNITARSPLAAGKFADEGRRADGGLRNGEFFTK